MDKEKIIDVDFTEEGAATILEAEITKELDKNKVYYTISQAAKLLGIEVSKLRYYSNFFALDSNGEELITVEYSNKNRAYTQENIDQFQRALDLMSDGMTLQQTKDYLALNGFDTEGKTLDTSNPLALTAFVSELNADMEKKLTVFQNNLLEKIAILIDHGNNAALESLNKQNEELKENITVMVDETISKEIKENIDGKIENLSANIIKKLEEQNQAQAKTIENLTKQLEKRDTDICNRLKESLDNQKNLQQQVNEKKGLFKRIFG